MTVPSSSFSATIFAFTRANLFSCAAAIFSCHGTHRTLRADGLDGTDFALSAALLLLCPDAILLRAAGLNVLPTYLVRPGGQRRFRNRALAGYPLSSLQDSAASSGSRAKLLPVRMCRLLFVLLAYISVLLVRYSLVDSSNGADYNSVDRRRCTVGQ
jgi:hypothetical protein